MIGIGPENTAGQAYRLAVALRREGHDAVSFTPRPHRLGFPVDRLAGPDFAANCAHVISWTGWPFEHPHVAYAYQGSEVRRPSIHRQREPWSPFGDDEITARYEARVRAPRQPAFVATLDLRDYVRNATWLPIIAEPAVGEPLFRRPKPRVLFAPTNAFLKGTVPPDPAYDLVTPAFMPPDEMLAEIARADVVVGGLRLGSYGGTEVQAMAAGRVVVGHVSPAMRSDLPDLPIVEADPATIVSVLRAIAADPDAYRPVAERGPAFHARWHDGRYAAAQVAGWIA